MAKVKIDAKQYIGFVKKNAVSLAAAVVAIGAMTVPFFVADPKVAEVKTAMESSASTAGTVESMVNKQRKQPVLDPTHPEAPPLNGFPTKSVTEAGDKAVRHLADQSAAMLKEAMNFNRHAPLVMEVFTAGPGTPYSAAFDRFKEEYIKIMPDGLNGHVNGRRPYLPEEIVRAVANEKEKIAQERSLRQNGVVVNQAEITELQRRAELEMPAMMKTDVAKRSSVYVSADTWMAAKDIPLAQTAPVREAVWLAQLGLWIQQDVCEVVKECNAGSNSVFTSPVKHIVHVDFVQANPYLLGLSPTGEATNTVPVTGVKPEAPINLIKAASVTGRVSNGLYDVVQYRLTVRVSESFVPQFLAQISKGRLQYVLNVQMRALNSQAEAATGFLYGNDRVVELQVTVESLFLRTWTEPLMPKAIRQMVGIEPPAPVTP